MDGHQHGPGPEIPAGFEPPRSGRWRNTGRDKVTHYQLVSSLRKPCGFCVRRHGRILDRPWPLPFHPNCQCDQLAILPDWEAPMVYRTPSEIFREMGPDAQANLVGHDNLRIIRAGLVDLSEVLGTPDTGWLLLAFTETVRRRKLTVPQLLAAGVDRATADRAVSMAKRMSNRQP